MVAMNASKHKQAHSVSALVIAQMEFKMNGPFQQHKRG